MTREEQINKAVESLLDEADVDILNRPLLRMWYKLGANFADKNPIDRTDWRQVRIQAAIAAMQGIFANEKINQDVDKTFSSAEKVYEAQAIIAVSQADALVKELKGE